VRIVLYVREDIPGLAPAGAQITVRTTDPTWPVVVQITLGPEALEIIRAHVDRVYLSPDSDPIPEAAELLALLLRKPPEASPPSTGQGPTWRPTVLK
jgi:hypothetical protein